MSRKLFYSSILSVLLPLCSLAQPVFKGGANALNVFISQHLIYPEYSRQNCLGATIRVGFKLDPKGKVYDVQVQQGPGLDLDDEAVRIVKLTSYHWNVPVGYGGGSTIVLPVRFAPDYSRCTNVSQRDMNAAMTAYLSRQELQNAVTNYYKNKYLGKADTSKQGEIDLLKQQLGYNDEFITDVLQQADEKLKQGDKDGACETWEFIRNIGSNRADPFLAKYCGK